MNLDFVASIEFKLKDNQDIRFHDLACSFPVKSQGYVCSIYLLDFCEEIGNGWGKV